MKKHLLLFTVFCSAAWAATQNAKPEPSVLPASAYRTSLEEIVVKGRLPYWQQQTPRWDKPKVEAPKPGEAAPGRLQFAPAYTREERDDYNEVRDPLNPKPRTKLFEVKF